VLVFTAPDATKSSVNNTINKHDIKLFLMFDSLEKRKNVAGTLVDCGYECWTIRIWTAEPCTNQLWMDI
jgi:hypothetical protein